MQYDFPVVISEYGNQLFQRYKNACAVNHAECKKINDLKTIEQIKSCQARCQYFYDYVCA